nr:MAG TPA: hypothetical protein [Caudoviricetes sp.]
MCVRPQARQLSPKARDNRLTLCVSLTLVVRHTAKDSSARARVIGAVPFFEIHDSRFTIHDSH